MGHNSIPPLRTSSQGPKVLQGPNSSLWEVLAEFEKSGHNIGGADLVVFASSLLPLMTSPSNTNTAVNDAPILEHASSDEEDMAFLRKAQLEAEEAQKCAEELAAAAKLRNDEIDRRKKAHEERKREEERKWLEAEKKREADKWEAKRIADAKAVEEADAE